jgi:hypothetical protein
MHTNLHGFLLRADIAVDPCSNRFAVLGTSKKRASAKNQKEEKCEGFITVFDVNSPAPCAVWDVKDVSHLLAQKDLFFYWGR